LAYFGNGCWALILLIRVAMLNRATVLLVIGMLTAVFAAACSSPSTGGGIISHRGGDDDDDSTSSAVTTGTSATSTVDGKDPNNVGPLPTSVTAKQYFTTKVFPALSNCQGCHASGPGPSWVAAGDADKTYTLVFGRGYITRDSMLMKKGAHDGGAAPALSTDQNKAVATWIELEMKERGDKAPPSVLEKLGDCMDETEFDKIGWENLQTVTRTADNNPNGETEDADDCTGCKPSSCVTCHASDPATGFFMAMGNTVLPANETFMESKNIAPPFLQKYFGLDTDGNPIASKAIRAKSDNTVNVAKAYQHPMFTLPPDFELRLNNFVDDTISKYKAGTCGK
jgi:hypothetical protein